MGFWGSHLIARSGVSLAELSALVSRGQTGVESDVVGDSWQLTGFAGDDLGPEFDLLRDICSETTDAALIGFVFDGDAVSVEFMNGQGDHGTAALSPNVLRGYCEENDVDFDATYPDALVAADTISSWASSGGLQPDRAEILRILREDGIGLFSGERLFFELLRACGLNIPQTSAEESESDR